MNKVNVSIIDIISIFTAVSALIATIIMYIKTSIDNKISVNKANQAMIYSAI